MKVVVYFITYMAISLLYRLVLVNYADPKHRQNFELVKLYQLYDNMLAFNLFVIPSQSQVCIYCRKFDAPTTITFLTGFYVTKVVERWWAQFMSLPWPDQLALKLVAYMPGKVS